MRLQAMDSELDALRRQRETLEERGALKGAQGKLTAATAEHRRLTAQLAELVRAQGVLSEQAESLTARAGALQKRLFGPEAAGVRDLASIDHELDTTRAHLAAVEDELLGLMEQVEEGEAALAATEAAMAQASGDAQRCAEALAAAESVVDAQALAKIKDRREFASGIDPSIVDRYDKIRSRMGGVAVASLAGRSCSGCHLELPATEIDHLRHGGGGDLPTCEACDRILVVS